MGRDEKCSLCSGYKVYKKVFRAREAWHSPKTLHIMFHDQVVRFITRHHPLHTHTSKGLPLSAIGDGVAENICGFEPWEPSPTPRYFYCNKRLDFNHYCNNKTLAYYLL